MKHLFIDERTEQINGVVSFLCLMLTHLGLVGVIVYKRYFLGLPQSAYAELSWIAGASMATYWAIRVYLSGILPVVPVSRMLLIYILLVAAIGVPTYFIHGWPAAERWYEVLYPFIGVAVTLVFYSLVAYFGKRRIEQITSR